MTVTARFRAEMKPLAERQVPSPFLNPPPGREPIGRLSFRGPSPKIAMSLRELADKLSSSLENAIFFLDTNIFSSPLAPELWETFCKRRIWITPEVWKELLPWLKTPFNNVEVREHVLAAVQAQAANEDPDTRSLKPVKVLLSDEIPAAHGYGYYLSLLGLRKAIGPIAKAVLQKQLGREPNDNELLAEVQGRFGARGLLMAKKGIEAVQSSNALTDEKLVITAALQAIVNGTEVYIITRDADVFEQYFKLMVLMKEHYRAMLVAEQYANGGLRNDFQEMDTHDDGVHIPEFAGTRFLQMEATENSLNPLPQTFNFVNINCFLLGGEPSDMRVTSCAFCAETQMAQMLEIKSATDGLNTDKLDGRNCIITTVTARARQPQGRHFDWARNESTLWSVRRFRCA